MIQLEKFNTVKLTKTILVISFCIFQNLVTQGLFAQPAVNNSVEVKTLNSEAGAASLYTLNFTLPDTLRPNAVLEVKFPPGFDLTKVNLAGSASINGGFKVSVQGQTIKVSRKGKGSLKYPGDKVDLKFSTVVNSSKSDDKHLVIVNLKKADGGNPPRELRGLFTVSEKKLR